jgi:hypothetical protein
MARERSELEQRGAELTRSLPGLSGNRAGTYRRGSDALALDRAGVTYEAEVAAGEATRDVQCEPHDVDAEIKLMPRRRLGAGARRAVRRARQPVIVLPVTRRAADSFEHPGLFIVPLDRARAKSLAAKTHEQPVMRPWSGRVAPPDRHRRALRRYCSGCAKETQHVPWAADGRGSNPTIRWPTTQLASGTTICSNCGQWRAASFRPSPPAWSSWPRSRIAAPSLAVAADSADTADDWASETAAESEGMPPRREPRRPRRSTARLRRARAVAR